jgi:Double-GTPase 2
MNAIDVITYQARADLGGNVAIQATTSIRDEQRADRWRRWLDLWLRTGRSPGIAYLDYEPEAAFIRFLAPAGSHLNWESARVLVGRSAELTGTYALELAESQEPGARRYDIEARARSAAAAASLTTVLAHALQMARRVTMPGTDPELAEAVMWGLIVILRMLGDTRPVSFLTCAPGNTQHADVPGMLVVFRADVAAPLPPDQGFAALAADLAGRFADDPDGLRQLLEEHGLPAAADLGGRISLLTTLPPRGQPGNAYRRGTATVSTILGEPDERPAPAVMCPICLGVIPNWSDLDYWRWDATIGEGGYVRIDIPPDLNPTQRARYTHGAYVRCPASTDVTTVAHYLPARYGRFGDPVLLGFVGLTQSGKTHLLASMIGQISELSAYGVDVTELDRATHRAFVEDSVKPLIAGHKVLPGTPDDASTTLTDALIVRQVNGPDRVVALFDVSGGDLTQRESTKEFLWIADGLFFVIDPDRIQSSKVGDESFSNVLDIMSQRPRGGSVCAAIVLNKADKARFDEPIARWLRAGNGTLDPTDFLRESADVYAYLENHQATELAKPYQVCRKATMHVASPTGGAQEGLEGVDKSNYPRGVTPLRVLRPLAAMLAMTGVLTGPQAEQIGV